MMFSIGLMFGDADIAIIRYSILEFTGRLASIFLVMGGFCTVINGYITRKSKR